MAAALVSDWSPLDPCRPGVEIIPEAKGNGGKSPPREKLNLALEPTLSVAMCDEVDVSQDLFYPASVRFDPVKARVNCVWRGDRFGGTRVFAWVPHSPSGVFTRPR